jgi:FkbM family methyltransferase
MFYGQSYLDKVIYETFFTNKRNGFFVECGAFDGLTECTCKFFEETMGWTGLNIEPVPYAFNKLIQNRPNCINEQYALSSINQKATFTNAIHPKIGEHFGNGSISHIPVHLEQLNNIGCTFNTFEVECIRFDDLCKKHNISNIDLFVLDVEGYELEVLKGILTIPKSTLPKIFCIEYGWSGQDLITKLIEEYYTYHSTYVNNSFFVRNF